MIPSDGLFHQWTSTYAGQMGLILAWLIAGFVAAGALTGVVLIRSGPQITTQVDLMTGKKEHGLIRWFGFWSLIFVAPPLLFGVVRTLIAAVDWLNANASPWWWLGLMLVAAAGVGMWAWRTFRTPGRTFDHSPLPAPEPVPEPSMGFTIDRDMPQWDQR